MFALALTAVLTATVTAYVVHSNEKPHVSKSSKSEAKKQNKPDALFEIEFCPGMLGTFDVLYSQRRRLARICSRWGALRPRVDDWRADVVVEAIETTDQILEANIGEVLNLLIIAGYNPRHGGFHQPEFDKAKVNLKALKGYAGENAELLDELDELITSAVEYSSVRVEFAASELRSWSATFRSVREFRDDFKTSKIA